MKTRAARLASIFVIFAAMETPAFAYLDGATGSIILQAAIGLFASGMVYFRLFKDRARNFFGQLVGKSSSDVDAK